MLDRLKAPQGANKKKKRLGRGESSGRGKTSGKGNKGQKARSGGTVNPGFEGGQMPLQRRLPKYGFTNRFKEVFAVLNVGRLSEVFSKDKIVDKEALLEAGLIKSKRLAVKILGDGEINVPLKVKAEAFSKSAVAKITNAGGQVEVTGGR